MTSFDMTLFYVAAVKHCWHCLQCANRRLCKYFVINLMGSFENVYQCLPIIITGTIFMVLSSCFNHCESLPSSSSECCLVHQVAARTQTKSTDFGCESAFRQLSSATPCGRRGLMHPRRHCKLGAI